MTGEQAGFPPAQGQEAPQLRVSPGLMNADTALGPPFSVSLVGLTDTSSLGGLISLFAQCTVVRSFLHPVWLCLQWPVGSVAQVACTLTEDTGAWGSHASGWHDGTELGAPPLNKNSVKVEREVMVPEAGLPSGDCAWGL